MPYIMVVGAALVSPANWLPVFIAMILTTAFSALFLGRLFCRSFCNQIYLLVGIVLSKQMAAMVFLSLKV